MIMKPVLEVNSGSVEVEEVKIRFRFVGHGVREFRLFSLSYCYQESQTLIPYSLLAF
jgi:hypothetical protein